MSRPASTLVRISLTLLQTLAFGGLFFVGGYWAEVRLALELRAMQRHVAMPTLIPLWRWHISATLDYVANGLIFASVLLVLILVLEALRKRLRPWATLSLLAFVIAFVASLLVHSGFVPLSNS